MQPVARSLAGVVALVGLTLVTTEVAPQPTRAATPPVTRYAGADRYETAADVSAGTFHGPVPVAFVARGDAYPDALAAGPAAAVDGGPVLLVGSSVPASTAAELTRLKPARIVVTGGPLAVPDSVVAALQSFTAGSVSRVAGADRFATAAAISAATFSPLVNAAYIATDATFADALAGAAAAGHLHDPILLVTPGQIPAATAQELTRLRPQSIVILGGPLAVSQSVAGSLARYTSGPISRLAGPDRYATAVAVSGSTFPTGSSTVYLATGLDFPDALAGGVAAALAPAPLLLVSGTCVPQSVIGEVTRLNPAQMVILGGDGAVGAGVNSLSPCGAASSSGAGCVFSSGAVAALCDTFDAPAGIGNRSGQLNGTLWGVSRLSGAQNFSAPANGWSATQLNDCGNTSTVFAPSDVVICNGQLHESVTDGGNVTALAMYPKQPFDFAGRTGKIVFDVSNDSQGSHAAWPEMWVTDQPLPAPFAHDSTLQSNPRNGFGLRFAGCNGNGCGDGSNFFSVDSAIAVSNYVENDSFSGGNLTVNDVGDVSKSGPGQMNHVEVDVSQGQIDVYATNAFTPGGTVPPLVHIAQIPNAGLTFTRGILWIEDAHYNGDKFNSQGTHTFTWDNVGFDGPVLPRDLAFDVADNPNGGGDLGYFIGSNSSLGVVDHGLYNVANASGALLTFNYYTQTAPVTFQYAINGHQHTLAWSNANAYSPGTMAISIPLSDVVTGDNTITFSTGGAPMTVMNIDLIMVGAGGVVGP